MSSRASKRNISAGVYASRATLQRSDGWAVWSDLFSTSVRRHAMMSNVAMSESSSAPWFSLANWPPCGVPSGTRVLFDTLVIVGSYTRDFNGFLRG